MEIQVAGRTLDVTKLRWTWGDWEDLEERDGITPAAITEGKVKAIVTLVWAALRKLDASISRDDVRSLDHTDPAIQAIIQAITQQQPDPKASTLSTSSPEPTGGEETN